MQPHFAVEIERVGDGEGGSEIAVAPVGNRHHGVEPVVASAHLHDHERATAGVAEVARGEHRRTGRTSTPLPHGEPVSGADRGRGADAKGPEEIATRKRGPTHVTANSGDIAASANRRPGLRSRSITRRVAVARSNRPKRASRSSTPLSMTGASWNALSRSKVCTSCWGPSSSEPFGKPPTLGGTNGM